jgi:glycosyltransferase involved in cell wall biosynthesis
LVEALITGIPLVASDIPMNLEAISPGRLSFIFPVGNHVALAEQMARLMTKYEEAKRIGMIARERAMENYDIKKVAAEYEAALIQVAYGK